ncbi:MAG: bifunctional metallophosphatase/5'-nucleotidase, partial [Oscillospiraceae bacterium]|nr:bifunctional metallophosphatase/5'-nucleotidase [Oscillospiraceae bacterium]
MAKRRLLGLLLALALLLSVAVPAMAEIGTVNLSGALVILHTNDIHGRAVADSATGALGYATIAKMKKDLQAAGASVLLLDAGDASQGSPLVNLSYGIGAFEFMNAAG